MAGETKTREKLKKAADRFTALASPADKFWWILLSVRLLLFLVLLVIFFGHFSWYAKKSAGEILYYHRRIAGIVFVSLAAVVLPAFRLKMPRWLEIAVNIAEAPAVCLLAFAAAESVWGYSLANMKHIRIAFNMILALTICLFFYVLTNRMHVSVMLTYILIAGFSILNYYVYQFRGENIEAADLFVAGTALNVAGQYVFLLTWRIFLVIWGGAVLFSVLNMLPADAIRLRGMKRAAFAAVSLFLIVWVGYIFTISDYPLKKGVEVRVFKTKTTYRRNGQLLNFVRSFYYMIVKTPEGYSVQEVKDQISGGGYASDPADLDDGAPNPNIIFVMNESLCDYTVYPDLEVSEDPLPFIHSLQAQKADNLITGTLHVDVFGGFTANSEYEVLTGNSVAFMPPNAVPYALYVRKPVPSFTWNLRDAGYQGCYAFHPYLKNGYSRPRAYPNLGFTDFVAIEDIRDTLTEEDYLREYVSDAGDFRKLIEFYEAAKRESSAPFYIYNVTMQNHGGYSKDFDNLELDIELGGGLKDHDAGQRFINLMQYSDQAIEELVEYFSGVDDPTILVMFGDHQGNLANSFYRVLYGKSPDQLEGDELFGRYETPLVIWANYDINAGGRYDEVFEDISINFLGARLTELAGIPMTGYQKFLVEMQESVPVFTVHGYRDRSGAIYDVDDTSSPWYDLVREYNMYVYNCQFDQRNRIDSFFELQCEENAMER